MGFSDSLKKISKQLSDPVQRANKAVGIDRATREVTRFANRVGTRNLAGGEGRRGRLGGSAFFSAALGGTFSKASLGSAASAMEARASGDLYAGSAATEQSVRASQAQAKESVYGANLGHQAYVGATYEGDGPTPPPVGPGPGVGAGDMSARQKARQRAIAAARRRSGSTTATSPLGVQGEGAATGQKRLLGE